MALAAGGGELNPLILGTDPSAVTPQISREFAWNATAILEDGAKAFGEMAALHYSFSNRHRFEYAPPDHPLFLLLADIAAERDVPIDLHMEAVLEDEPTSEALLHRSQHKPDMTLRPEWVQLLRDFPDRFMVGADEFIGIPERTTPKGPPSFEDTWRIIQQLPDDVREQVGRLNAARVYRLE